MKLNGSMLVIVAMMAGAMGAAGCKSGDDKVKDTGNAAAPQGDTKAATPEDNPDSAPATEGATINGYAPGVERDARFYTTWAPRAPPALRVEERGVGPAGHWWRPGYYGWNGHDHVWYGGRWYAPRAGYNYISPRWHNVGGRWGYYPGHWHR